MDVVVERCGAVDIGKAVISACVRVPDEDHPGRRRQEVRDYSTMTRSVYQMIDWMRVQGVTLVAMEATSDYWKPVYYLLEEHFEVWLVNPRHIKGVPGRKKTDRIDAAWICKVTECGLIQPSFVPPPPIRRLRDLTRYRTVLIRERTRECQRLEKTLEDAQIKLSAVIADILGVSGRAMLEAMIAGERDPRTLARMAQGRMKAKTGVLIEAFTGRFTDHHAFLCRMMLRRIDAINAELEELNTRIDAECAPFRDHIARLDAIPGVGVRIAQIIIAEIGVDMTRFPTAARLTSWAKVCPGTRQSAGKIKGSATGHGDAWLQSALGEAASTARRTKTFIAARYHRLVPRRGKKRALVAIERTILTAVWHILADPTTTYHDLGHDYYHRRTDPEHRRRRAINDLQHLGYNVILEPAA